MKAGNPDIRFTYRDYTQLPEDRRYELIDGDFYMVPAPRPFHQIISRRIVTALSRYVEEHDLGEVLDAPCDVKFSEHDVVQPDILFVSKERLVIIEKDYVGGPPDLVIEILSESTAARDKEIKRRVYSRYGVKEYWIVDPDGSIQVLTRRQAELSVERTFYASDVLVSPLLVDFRLTLSDVFRPLSA